MLYMGSTEEYVSGYQIRAVYFEEVLLSPVIINICTFFFFSFIFISWRLITLQYYSGFCHTLT